MSKIPPIKLSPQEAPVISLDGVSLNLTSGAGEVNILRDINLQVPRGQSIGLVGPSGAGKTSLMMIVAGLERASAGEVVIGGFSYQDRSEDDLAKFRRGNVGVVFQDFHLIGTMTALENVALPLEFAGRPDAFERAEAALDAVGLGARIVHYPGQLSGGEQQRVALARAFVGNPALLLADEPTGNLDQETGDRVIELMFTLAKTNSTTMVLITHDPAIAERCDRIIRIVNGRIVDENATDGRRTDPDSISRQERAGDC
ncbi:MAG: ABC transporter ATP-binding protein [Alphaproteobacteria bacterium]|nr:ABC transporter ATP-binding protein [Alphaproteobacteria bacterium]